MSNGYLVASAADLAAAHEIGAGFGLDVLNAAAVTDHATTASTLANAANVGLLISMASVRDSGFVALLRSLSLRLQTAQLIFVDADARAELGFLPRQWPAMSIEDARSRAARRLQANQPAAPDATRAHPIAPAAAEPPHAPEAQLDAPTREAEAEVVAPEPQPAPEPDPTPHRREETELKTQAEPPPFDDETELLTGGVAANDEDNSEQSASQAIGAAATHDEPVSSASAPADIAPQRPAPEEAADAVPPAPVMPQAAAPPAEAARTRAAAGATSNTPATAAPADATAFAPKKLRRGTPELVRIVIHQPKQLKDVIKAARKIDARAEPAPQGMRIGEVALGATVGVSLDVRGAACDGALQKRAWTGEPIDFNFTLEAEDGVKQAVILARVFVGDAQIGVIAFTRGVTGAKKEASPGDARLQRTKRVFLSYSSADRETVSVIATAYEMAGVPHFWDRTSLKSGEEWSPRLRKEIDRADLFHLCWSKAAAQSEWVEKEAEHALTRRRKTGKKPAITVQMLDGPPWAPHPAHLDAINFDDFVRAAIVGYARGDGSEEAKAQ